LTISRSTAPSVKSTATAPVVVVIPAFRAAATIVGVVERALTIADAVVVVDDACPERCGERVRAAFEPGRVHVVAHEENRGVGGATKTGLAFARRLGATFAVKLDADDQMDAACVPRMIDILRRHPAIAMVKGNRFAHVSTLREMPIIRLIGNAALTLLVKFSSGYWTIVDPTNGFLAIRIGALDEATATRLSDGYFFEIDLICALGLRRMVIAELEMPPVYRDAPSSLSIGRVVASFPGLLLSRFVRRLLVNYLVCEINVGSLCALFGVPLLLFSLVFGLDQWHESLSSGIPRPTGTIILSLLLFMVGFQLSLQACLYDVQFATRTVTFRRDRANEREPDDDLWS
jgi:glycosyltransferase involved in cell wall biosynthesis